MIEDQNSSYKMACVVRPPLFMGARRTLFYDSSIVCRPYHREGKYSFIYEETQVSDLGMSVK